MSLLKAIYDKLDPLCQSYVDRIRYRVGGLPRVNRLAQASLRKDAKTALIISADLELAWAWRFVKGETDPQSVTSQKAEQTRRNLPGLLKLFDEFNMPVTWATIGHLFLEGCERRNGGPHAELPRPPHFANEYWQYMSGDWYESDPCTDYRRAPAWYAPDLLETILSAKTKHEIACHTFSHIDCSDGNCPAEVADAELDECQRLAGEWGIRLKSFVFPGNLVGNLLSLKKHGFTSYRWHGKYELNVPRRDELGLWQIPGGVLWEKPAHWPVNGWVKAMQKCVDRALKTNAVLHFWFHPSCDPVNREAVFPRTLEYIASHRGDWSGVTMGGLAEQLALSETP
jgi:peptidoglycan/xylan/chitin deacetylase (PgdA/CDA1 family)